MINDWASSVFKFVKKYQFQLLLAGFSLVAFLVRFVFQPKIPFGFHRDEAGILYSAYSIARTGRDEWGRLLPLHFKALGDYPPGIYNYLTSLFVLMIGPVPSNLKGLIKLKHQVRLPSGLPKYIIFESQL